MTPVPGWMSKLIAIDERRKATEAELARLEALAEAAHQRMLGAALVEALAFVLDVALPPKDVNEVVLDGVRFWLDAHDVEPITERDADFAPCRWNFTLHVAPALPTIQSIVERSFAFMEGEFPMPELHEDRMSKLALHVIRLVDEMHLAAAAGSRSIMQLVSDMHYRDNLQAAAAVEALWVDFEFEGGSLAVSLIAAAMANERAELATIRNYLLSEVAS